MNRIQIQNLSKSNNSIRELKQGDHELSNIRGGGITRREFIFLKW